MENGKTQIDREVGSFQFGLFRGGEIFEKIQRYDGFAVEKAFVGS